MAKQSIGEFLATLRRAKGYTQMTVSEKLGISNRTLSAWECGAAMPDIMLLPALADIYEVTVDEILAGERLSSEKKERAVEISEKSQRKLLRSRLSTLTIPSFITSGTLIVGIILFTIGYYKELITYAWSGWQWWLLLLYFGLVTIIISFAVLVANYAGAFSSADEETEGYAEYSVLLARKFSDFCYIISAAFILGFTVSCLLPRHSQSHIPLCIVLAAFGIASLLTGFIISNHYMKKYENASIREVVNDINKKVKRLALVGLIPLALTIAFAGVIIYQENNTELDERILMTAKNRTEFITEAESLYFDASIYAGELDIEKFPESGTYYFDISHYADSSESNIVQFSNGFWGEFSALRNSCKIYLMIDMDDDGTYDKWNVASADRYYAEDNDFSVFILKYWDFPIIEGNNGSANYIIDVDDSTDEITLILPRSYKNVYIPQDTLLVFGLLTFLYYVFVFAYMAVKRRKIKISL